MAAKSKKTNKPVPMSPNNYIKTKARSLPIYHCFINKTDGICSIVISRKMPSGNFITGFYMVDMYCLGLKNTYYGFNETEDEYEFVLNSYYPFGDLTPIRYAEAHNYIYGAIAYAEDLGFKPNKDWAVSQYILEEDTDDIALIEYEFGMNGKPHFINGPYDDVNRIVTTLKKSVGEGNFDTTIKTFDEDEDDFVKIYNELIEFGEDFDETSDDEDDDTEDTDFTEVTDENQK